MNDPSTTAAAPELTVPMDVLETWLLNATKEAWEQSAVYKSHVRAVVTITWKLADDGTLSPLIDRRVLP